MIIFESSIVVIFFGTYWYVTSIVKKRTVVKRCVDVDIELLRKQSSASDALNSTGDGFASIDADKPADLNDIKLSDGNRGSAIQPLKPSDKKESNAEEETYKELELVEGEYDFTVVRFGYSFLSGLLGGQSIIFAKTVIELIKVTMFGKNQGIEYMCFANIDFYVYLVAMVTVLVAQTDILNSGLKHFEALKIVPVFITFYQIFGVIGGGLYYEEFEEFTLTNWILFPVGCLISFFGIYILSMKPGSMFAGAKDEDGGDHARPSIDRLSRDFRTSVHLPLLSREDSESVSIAKGRRSVVERLRRSMTSDDIKLLSKELSGHSGRPSKVERGSSDPTGLKVANLS